MTGPVLLRMSRTAADMAASMALGRMSRMRGDGTLEMVAAPAAAADAAPLKEGEAAG